MVDFRTAGYGATLLLTSAGGLVVEIVAGRLIAPYVGMSLYTWTAIIAVVLAGFSAGHWIGGLAAGPAGDRRRGIRTLAVVLGLAAATTFAAVPLLRQIAGPVLDGNANPVVAVVVLTSLLFFLPSLFVGVVSPVLTKLAVDAAGPPTTGRVIGRMYALGALGSIGGTLAAGYLFISWLGSTWTMFAIAAVYAALALAYAAEARRLAIAVVAVAVLTAGGAAWVLAAGALRSPCLVESDYFCIRVEDAASLTGGRASAVMVLDHLVHSINDRDDPTLLASPYLHLVDELVRQRVGDDADARFSAYFIGGGAFTLPRAIAARWPASRLLVAEIDPAVTRVARTRLWLADAPAIEIRHVDARRELQSLPAAAQFDLVLGDAFHDISVPTHLVTTEFDRQIAARLKPAGLYAVNVVDSGAEGPPPRFLYSMVKTLQRVFPHVEVWIDSEEAAAARLTYVIVAGVRPSTQGRISARHGMARTWARWPPADLAPRIAAAAVPVLTDDYAPVARLMAPLLTTPAGALR